MRTNIAAIFIRTALRQHPEKTREVLKQTGAVDDNADAFAQLDYNVFRGLAFASGNPIYGLILNGLKGLYIRVGRYYFSNPDARRLALDFYKRLETLCHDGLYEQVMDVVRHYGKESGAIWHSMQSAIPHDIAEIRR